MTIDPGEFKEWLQVFGVTGGGGGGTAVYALRGCRAAYVGNVDADYDNGDGGVGATLTMNDVGPIPNADGVTLQVDDRVLFWEQTSAIANGIYKVVNTGGEATPGIFERVHDFDTSASIVIGAYTVIAQGDTLYGKVFVQATKNVTVGVSNIVFAVTESGSAFSPQYVAYVAKGNPNPGDGTRNNPYESPMEAMLAVSGTPTQQTLIQIESPGLYEPTVDFPIKPHVDITCPGVLGALIESDDEINLDASWGSISGVAFNSFTNLLFEINIDCDFSISSALANVWTFFGCHFGNDTIFRGTTGKIPQLRFYSCRLPSPVFEACLAEIYGGYTNNNFTVQGSAGGGTGTVRISAHKITQNLTISGVSGSTQNVTITDTYIGGTITLDGTFCTLSIDATSMPAAGITYANGATSGQVTPLGNAPFREYNNAFKGQNYNSPVAITSSSNITAWNLNTAPAATQTMTQNTTLQNPTNQIAGMWYSAFFTQGASPYTLTLDSGYEDFGVPPVMSTAAGSKTMLIFYSDGTTMYLMGVVQ